MAPLQKTGVGLFLQEAISEFVEKMDTLIPE
jgi:hypothetical protein